MKYFEFDLYLCTNSNDMGCDDDDSDVCTGKVHRYSCLLLWWFWNVVVSWVRVLRYLVIGDIYLSALQRDFEYLMCIYTFPIGQVKKCNRLCCCRGVWPNQHNKYIKDAFVKKRDPYTSRRVSKLIASWINMMQS